MESDEFRPWYGLVGKSEPMMRLYEEIKSVADSDSTVLLNGESGTGKELVARAIHYLSPRTERVYKPLNCSAIPVELFESELFGYKKGAFTGATGDKAGLIAEAEGGTIFLDEIGEMSPYLQAKLLRTIEEKSFGRVGDTKSMEFDVRFIVATSKSHAELTDKNSFNTGLYYRINQLGIDLPPLRERGDDILLLTRHFLSMFNAKYKKDIKFDRDALMEMKSYNWPGNVRQLMSLVEKYVVKSKQGTVISKENIINDLEQTKKREPTLQDLHRELAELRKATEKGAKASEGNKIEAFTDAIDRIIAGLAESRRLERDDYKHHSEQLFGLVKDMIKEKQQPPSGGVDQFINNLRPQITELIKQEFGDAVSYISGKLAESFRADMHDLIKEGMKTERPALKVKSQKKIREQNDIRLRQKELAEAAGVPGYTITNAVRLGSLPSEGKGMERTISVYDALGMFKKRDRPEVVAKLKKYIKEKV